MWTIIKIAVPLVVGFIAGLLVGRKTPKLADAVHDEGQLITEKIKK